MNSPNIISSLNNDSAVIYFPNGVYLFEQPIDIVKKLIIRGESSDSTILLFNLAVEDHLIKIEGNATGDESQIVNDIYKDSIRIEVSNPSIFIKGDYIKITENDSSLVTSSWAMNSTGQINRIDSISNNYLFLLSPLRRNFYTSRNVKLIKLNLTEEVGLENLQIMRLDTTVQQTSNIYFNYAVNCRIKCVESFNCNFSHILVNNSTNIEVSGCYIQDALGYGNGGKAYGVMLQSSTGECLIKENIFNHLRHSMILQAGANGNVFAYNYSIDPYWTGVSLPSNSAGDIVLHGNYPYANLFEGNTVQNIVIDDSHGQNGMYNTFFRNRAELYGIFMNSSVPTNNQNFIGNEITNTGFMMGNYILNGTGHFQYGNNVKGTIKPTGSNNLPEASLFLDSIPDYYKYFSSWPPIGIPNSLKAFRIKAQERYNAVILTNCSDTPNWTNVNETENITFTSLLIYPNPTSDNTIIETSQNANIEIINMQSQILVSLKTNDLKTTIDLSNLSSGVYIIKVETDKGIAVKKLIKQ